MQLERITSWNEEAKTALKEYRRSKDKKWDITWTDESSGKKNKKLWNKPRQIINSYIKYKCELI